jgi:hypothetical protein
VVPDSTSHTFNSAGTFYWQATYSGDANNNDSTPVTSPCDEILVVSPNAVTVSTTLTNEDSGLTADGGSTLAAAIGDTVHDSATLDGQTADAGGTISYAFYTDDACSLNASDQTPDPDDVVDGVVPDSTSHTFNSAGTFYWQATYSGDANNNDSTPVTSPCDEILVVSPNEPTITTQVKKDSDDSNVDNNAHVPTGTVVYDTALLDGATSDVSGDVTYYVEMGDATCSVDGATSLGAKTIDAGLVPDSDNFTLATAGTYYFWADYEGDNNNLGATSACDTEIVIVDASRTGQITPTGTTCKQFDSGLAETLSQLKYGVKNGKVNNVAPGVFFYWIKVTVVAAGPQSFTIQQSITSSDNNFPHFFTTASGSFVYNSSCVKVTTQSVSSTGTVTFTAPTAGTYIIGVKYDAGSVKGFNAPSPNTTVDYRFEIPSVPGSAQDLHLIKG